MMTKPYEMILAKKLLEKSKIDTGKLPKLYNEPKINNFNCDLDTVPKNLPLGETEIVNPYCNDPMKYILSCPEITGKSYKEYLNMLNLCAVNDQVNIAKNYLNNKLSLNQTEHFYFQTENSKVCNLNSKLGFSTRFECPNETICNVSYYNEGIKYK